MLPVYKRLGIEPTEMLVRFAKPLRAERTIQRWIKAPALSTALATIANGAFGMRDWFSLSIGDYDLSVHSGPCTEEFNELNISAAPHYSLCTNRSATYLNWRYKNHYAVEYEFLIVRNGSSKLLGYLVYTRGSGNAEIIDLYGVDEPQMLAALVCGAVHRLRADGALTISISLLSSDPRITLLERLGFYRREGCPVVVYPGKQNGEVSCAKWVLMQGDRES
jgi:hypothetical protein